MVRGPIAIYIGSKMPSEIAASIMAEVLAVKNGVSLPRDTQVRPAKDRIQPREAGAPVCFSGSRTG